MPVKLNGSTSGYAQIQAAATAANNTLTLPSGNGMLVGQSTTNAPTNGQIPIGNGTDYTPATITAGTGITITNGSGTISIANTGGAVTGTQLAKAWGSYNFVANGSVPTLKSAYNITSITRNSTGNYTFAFTNALSDANYSIVAMPYYSSSILPSSMITYSAKTTSSVTLATGYVNSGGANATPYDFGCDFVVFGN